MRLVAGALALALFASLAHADDPVASESGRPAAEATSSRLPFRLVRVMPESRQALLFDRSRATHVLVEIGGKLDGYTIEDIDDEAITLVRDGKQIVLAAPSHGAHGGNRRRDRDAVPVRSAAARAPDASDTTAPAPVDPYGAPAVRVASAAGAARSADSGDAGTGEAGIRVASMTGAAHAPASGEAGTGEAGTGGAGIRVASMTEAAHAPASGDAGTGEAGIRVVSAPSTPGSGPIAAGEGGIRVAEAPGAASRSASPSAMAGAPGPSFPEVTAASDGVGGSRTAAASGISNAPDPGGIRVAPAPDRPAAGSPIGAGPIRVVAAPSGPPSDAARAPDKATLDARALADVMTSGPRARGSRTPRTLTPEAPSASPPATEVRPVTHASSSEARPADAVLFSRSELDTALGDFARLTAAIRGSFSASGVVIESVGQGSIFERAGLRAGDIVVAVDGVRLHSLDDAANLYARAATAKAITAQILRAGKSMTLHVVLE